MSECDCEETCLCRDCDTCCKETLLWTLEHKFSMRILMCLEVSGPITFNEMATIVADDRGSARMIFLRFHELAELGLVETVRGARLLRQLTPEGHRVAERLLRFFEEVEP